MKPYREEELLHGTSQDLQEMREVLTPGFCHMFAMDVSETQSIRIKMAQILRGFIQAPAHIREAILVSAGCSTKEEARVASHIVLRNEMTRIYQSNESKPAEGKQ